MCIFLSSRPTYYFFLLLSAQVCKEFCNLVANGKKVSFSATGLQNTSESSLLVVTVIMPVGHNDMVEEMDAHQLTGSFDALCQFFVLPAGGEVA